MFAKLFANATVVHAHCDLYCGVYDPADARIKAEAVLSMTKKILGLEMPQPSDGKAMIGYVNTLTRFIAIKEEQAQKTKDELLILWTDFFKPKHLEANPEIHDIFWKAAKLCSACKVEVSLEQAPIGAAAFLFGKVGRCGTGVQLPSPMCGTTCTAVAPVPRMPTRFPFSPVRFP